MNETPLPTDFEVNALIPIEGENLMFLFLSQNNVKRKALIDTLACDNAMPA